MAVPIIRSARGPSISVRLSIASWHERAVDDRPQCFVGLHPDDEPGRHRSLQPRAGGHEGDRDLTTIKLIETFADRLAQTATKREAAPAFAGAAFFRCAAWTSV